MTPLHITPRAAVKNDNSGKKIKEIHEKWYFLWENMKIRIDMYCGEHVITCNLRGPKNLGPYKCHKRMNKNNVQNPHFAVAKQ